MLTPQPTAKVFAVRQLVRQWRMGALERTFETAMPDAPAWPDAPQLLPPRDMPRRSGSAKGRLALWHALAHIEFVAIDLALDMAGRFGADMGQEFVDDFLSVAADEAMHFALLDRKLRSHGSYYGALPAHDGLWQAAHETRHDVLARLAIVPMVLEARGLDVTPATIAKVRAQGDHAGVKILTRILDDEIRHVAFGTKHFVKLCRANDERPSKCWQTQVNLYFRGGIKAPFNDSARLAAGLSREFYESIAS